jgi:hypothetical protein
VPINSIIQSRTRYYSSRNPGHATVVYVIAYHMPTLMILELKHFRFNEHFIWMVLYLAVHVISLSFAFLVASSILLRWSEGRDMSVRTEHGIKIACVFLYDSASKFLDSEGSGPTAKDRDVTAVPLHAFTDLTCYDFAVTVQ